MVRTEAYDENILDHQNHVPASQLADRVIVEEPPINHPTADGYERRATVWKLLRVYADGTIGWDEEPLATVYRNRDYRAIFEP